MKRLPLEQLVRIRAPLLTKFLYDFQIYASSYLYHITKVQSKRTTGICLWSYIVISQVSQKGIWYNIGRRTVVLCELNEIQIGWNWMLQEGKNVSSSMAFRCQKFYPKVLHETTVCFVKAFFDVTLIVQWKLIIQEASVVKLCNLLGCLGNLASWSTFQIHTLLNFVKTPTIACIAINAGLHSKTAGVVGVVSKTCP